MLDRPSDDEVSRQILGVFMRYRIPANGTLQRNYSLDISDCQDPGSFNSLGSIRINFSSAYGVYMHDTPLKNLFGDDLEGPTFISRTVAHRRVDRRYS
jgi:hypothetical protein